MFFAVGSVGLRIVDGELVCALGRMLSRHRAVAGRNVNTPKGGLGDNWLSWERSFKYPTRRLLSGRRMNLISWKQIFFFHTNATR